MATRWMMKAYGISRCAPGRCASDTPAAAPLQSITTIDEIESFFNADTIHDDGAHISPSHLLPSIIHSYTRDYFHGTGDLPDTHFIWTPTSATNDSKRFMRREYDCRTTLTMQPTTLMSQHHAQLESIEPEEFFCGGTNSTTSSSSSSSASVAPRSHTLSAGNLFVDALQSIFAFLDHRDWLSCSRCCHHWLHSARNSRCRELILSNGSIASRQSKESYSLLRHVTRIHQMRASIVPSRLYEHIVHLPSLTHISCLIAAQRVPESESAAAARLIHSRRQGHANSDSSKLSSIMMLFVAESAPTAISPGHILHQLADLAPALEMIELGRYSEDLNIFTRFKQLKTLIITSIDSPATKLDDAAGESTRLIMPNLTSLDLNNGYLSHDGNEPMLTTFYLPALTSIRIDSTTLTLALSRALLACTPNLTDLTPMRVDDAGGRTLDSIAQFTQLTTLAIHHLVDSGPRMPASIGACTRLTSVDLCATCFRGSPDWSAMWATLPALTDLRAPIGCEPHSLNILACDARRQIRRLTITQPSDISLTELDRIVDLIPHCIELILVKCLDSSHCRRGVSSLLAASSDGRLPHLSHLRVSNGRRRIVDWRRVDQRGTDSEGELTIQPPWSDEEDDDEDDHESHAGALA